MSDTSIAVPLHSRRQARALLFQQMQHAIPAFGPAAGGARAIAAGVHGFELGSD